MGKIKAGDIFEIAISENRVVFGRLWPSKATTISVYNFVVDKKSETFVNFDFLIKTPVMFYCGVYRDILTKGVFPKIGNQDFSMEEIEALPPFFTQSVGNPTECSLDWLNGMSRQAKPNECIGIEKSTVWEANGIVRRIEDKLSGRKNFYEELFKVILDQTDVRWSVPSSRLRWDFEKEEFYLPEL